MDKRLFVQLNGSRKVVGVLRGYDVCSPLPSLPRSWLYRSFWTLCSMRRMKRRHLVNEYPLARLLFVGIR